jgi:hypothetical protein
MLRFAAGETGAGGAISVAASAPVRPLIALAHGCHEWSAFCRILFIKIDFDV